MSQEKFCQVWGFFFVFLGIFLLGKVDRLKTLTG
jgi:hypothetical protein